MTTSLGLVDAFEKAAQIRRNRSRGLRDLSLFSPVAANRDAAAGAKMSTAASTREAVPPGAPTVAYTPGATRPEPSTRQWTPTPSVRVTRDTRTEGSSSVIDTGASGGDDPALTEATLRVNRSVVRPEPHAQVDRGQMSSVGGETRSEHATPVVLTVGGPALDSLPLVVHEAPGVSGSAVHVGHVTAHAVTDGRPRLGEAL